MINTNEAKRSLRVLYWDIETCPGLYYGWSMRYEPFYQVKNTAISCIGYKWEHEEKVHIIHHSQLQHKVDPYNDKRIIKKMCKIINEADVMVAHNGDSFDWKKFNARVLFHGLPPVKKPKLIDTLKLVRSQMKFDSHKLGCLAKMLKVPLKIETEKNLFVKSLTNWNSYKKLYEYCVGDVIALEAIHKKLEPYVKPVYHKGKLAGIGHSCASCGSENIIKFGKYMTAVREVPRYRCKDCLSTTTVDTLSKRNNNTRGVI